MPWVLIDAVTGDDFIAAVEVQAGVVIAGETGAGASVTVTPGAAAG